jgi:hypothetical protein
MSGSINIRFFSVLECIYSPGDMQEWTLKDAGEKGLGNRFSSWYFCVLQLIYLISKIT